VLKLEISLLQRKKDAKSSISNGQFLYILTPPPLTTTILPLKLIDKNLTANSLKFFETLPFARERFLIFSS
jgi:hypothetical protein